MAYTIELQTHTDERGSLTAIERVLPFEIRRVYYIHNVSGSATRGGHGHREEKSALICLKGSCRVEVHCSGEQSFFLDRPDLCLVCSPDDWHEIKEFSEDAVLLVLASTHYDRGDYVFEKSK